MKKGRIGSILLILAMLLQFIPAYANAAESGPFGGLGAEDARTVSVETQAGVYEDVEVTEETTVTDGVETVTQTAEDFVTDNGMIVDYDSMKTTQTDGIYLFEDHYTAQDESDLYEAEGGSDRSNEYHAPKSEIGIKITEDDIDAVNEIKGDPVGLIETIGDVKESEDDGVYGYSTAERITQSVINVVTKSLEITDAHGEVNPDDMEYLHTEMEATKDLDFLTKQGRNQNSLSDIPRLNRPPTDEIISEIKEGYQYINLESDQHAAYWPAWLYSVPGNENEVPQYDDGTYRFYTWDSPTSFGNHLKKTIFYLPNRDKVNVENVDTSYAGGIVTRWDNVCFYTLADRNKNLITTYCADQRQNSNEGYSYNISNLEDAEYYEPEQAKHIRAICNNGYWGAESGFGSLTNLKQLMLNSGLFTDEEISMLTPGMAMCAMQMAIWSYSNVIKNNMTFLNVHHVNFLCSISRTAGSANAADPDVADLIMKLYWFLQDLEPEEIPEDDITTENTIINEKNFLKSASLTITGKPEDHANNKDADKTNDVYTVDFTLGFKVKPSDENGDDLVLNIFDQNNNLIVAGRIAGRINEGEVQATVSEDGEYTLSNIQLKEGETALKFALSGSQNLKNDVYFFTSEHRETGNTNTEWSQPMVGIASGKRDVNIWMDIAFQLDVTDEELVKEHVWRTEEFFVDIPVTKEWDDGNNQDGLRPNKIFIHLFADGTEIDSATVEPDENGNWSYTFNHLPKFNGDGEEIAYTVTENPVTKYETDIDGHSIINHQLIDIPVTKTWDDDGDRDGLRPDHIVIHLFADGTEIDKATVEPDENGDWSYTFTDLLKYRDGGVEIVYTVTEDAVDEYGTVIEGYGITNTHEPEPIDIPVTKTWDDDGDRDGLRPDHIVIHLFADGTEIDKATVEPDENGNWSYTFTDLLKYRDGGVEIVYTVTEDAVDEYGTVIEGYGITNTHEPEPIDIPVTKTWDDDGDRDGLRPDHIVIHLFADGTEIDKATVEPDENGDWSYMFTDLPEYRDGGVEIKYTVTEEPVENYETEINGYEITNRYVPETTEIEIHKIWDDDDDRDGLRPDSITVNLLADGEIVDTVEVTPDENGDWSCTFTDLTKYRDHGVEIEYTVTEEPVENYETEINGYEITNRHVPETTEIEIHKIWDDDDDRDGLRPDSITVNLLADGEIVDTVEVTPDENGDWSCTFTDLTKYRDGGVEIVYSISEETVTSYRTEINGFTITNRHVPGTVDIPVTKTWDDDNNRDGLRPESVTVNLLADGEIVRTVEIVPDEDGNWAYTFTELPISKNGAKIVYSITEEPVENYESEVNGFAITNKYIPETTEIEIRKIWDDADDQDGLRPDSITVNLLADGEIVEMAVISPDENGDWTYTFTDLLKYRDGGVEIVYTVTEEKVTGYTAEIDGYTFTNHRVPATVEIKVEKIWVDSDNEYNSRPDSITIRLLADGEIIRTAKVAPDKDGNWTYTFKDLPKCKDGVEIKYTIEEDPVKGYVTSVNGYRVTNTFTPPTGDSFNPTLMFALVGASLLGLAAVIIVLRRRRREE